jgi:hypothetical protein
METLTEGEERSSGDTQAAKKSECVSEGVSEGVVQERVSSGSGSGNGNGGASKHTSEGVSEAVSECVSEGVGVRKRVTLKGVLCAVTLPNGDEYQGKC